MAIISKKKPNKRRAIVLGIGNTIRLDDGVGIVVVETLENSLKNQLNVEFDTMQTGGVDILSSIDGFDFAVIVDAAFMNAEAGDAKWLSTELLDRDVRLYSSDHSASVLETISMAKSIDNLDIPKEIAILGIQVKETKGFGEKLTDPVVKGAKIAFKMILDKLKEWDILEKDLVIRTPSLQ